MKKIDTVDPREDKLPVWAREMLADARCRTTEAEAKAEALRQETRPDESNTIIRSSYGKEIGLGKSPRVVFKIPVPPGERWVDHHDYVEARLDEFGRLVLHGGSQLVVVPHVTNVVYVELRRR